MAKRGIENQLHLLFESDLIEELFSEFLPTIEKMHELQDQPNSTSGNCFDWWRSRFYEFVTAKREAFKADEYIKMQRTFPDIWQRHEREMTRHKWQTGVPRRAYEF